MSNLKLGVDIVRAHNLLPRNGEGSSNAYVELFFDGQKFQSTTKEKDLNPMWNESFYFKISDRARLNSLTLDAYVYSTVKANNFRRFLGKVSIGSTSFVPLSDAVVLQYQLEKQRIFSRIRGVLSLKVYIIDDPSINGKPHPLKLAPMRSDLSAKPEDYLLWEVRRGGRAVGGRANPADKLASAYDLVVHIHFLYVRVVKARELPAMDVSGSINPYVQVIVGDYKGTTKHFEKSQSPEWNRVFAFSKERLQSSVLHVVVKDKDMVDGDFVGIVSFDIDEVPQRVSPNGPLAPEWYRLKDKKREKIKGELMLAVWVGTQADEAFLDAWHSDAVTSAAAMPIDPTTTRPKVYHVPRLWYVSVNILEAQGLVSSGKNCFPNVYVKAKIGNQVMQTEKIQTRSFNPLLIKDLLLVAAEPFEDPLILSVEDQVGPGKEETIGRVIIHLSEVEKRADDRIINSRWFHLEKPEAMVVDQIKKEKSRSKIRLQVCLDGGYHVLDEALAYCSDLRPTAKQLWKPSIGVLDVGILSAAELPPVKKIDGMARSDTYCVAKYGHQWVRTRTIVDNPFPRYNEQYTWEVFDRATVLTVGVFDNGQLGKNASNCNGDSRIGKVKIRISILEPGRVYSHWYPLLVLEPTGVKKMGRLHLAIRFSCTSMTNLLFTYSQPLLPMMHYVRPLKIKQLNMCRQQGVTIVAERLGRAELPLRKEIVEYMYEVDSSSMSLRKSKVNFFRVMAVISLLLSVVRWFVEICMWRHPIKTVFVHVLFLMSVCFAELILPSVFLFMFLVGVWRFRYRPRHPPFMYSRLSQTETLHPDELDEEFDTPPTSPNVLRMRYDRLRTIAGRLQTVAGIVATQGERFQALLSWRDPCATAIFVTFCLVTAIVLYTMLFRVVVALAGLYLMRHPRFRRNQPSAPASFFHRLPA